METAEISGINTDCKIILEKSGIARQVFLILITMNNVDYLLKGREIKGEK